MSVYDPRVDAYIEKAAAFAQPILIHLRELIHRHCPDVVETIKWGFPHFEYNNGCNSVWQRLSNTWILISG